jgi:hypothetical protein
MPALLCFLASLAEGFFLRSKKCVAKKQKHGGKQRRCSVDHRLYFASLLAYLGVA